MKRRIIAALVLVALAAGGGYAWLSPQFAPAADAGLTLYGNVDIREVDLGFRVAGRLQAMHFEEGDAVAAGVLLAELDAQPLQEALAVAEAGVLQAQAQLDRLNSGSRPQEVQQAQARVAEAEAALENAELEFARQQGLFDDGLNSRHALDAALARRDQSAARLRANQEALGLAVEGFRQEDIAAAKAALGAALARRDQAKTQVQDAQLLAPSPGVILTRALEPGAILKVGSPVYTLSLTETLYVRAYVSEASLGRVVPGTAVRIRTDSTERAFSGQVGFVSPRAEFTPKTVETPELRTDLVYRLRIVVADPDPSLRQGMPVTVEVPTPAGTLNTGKG